MKSIYLVGTLLLALVFVAFVLFTQKSKSTEPQNTVVTDVDKTVLPNEAEYMVDSTQSSVTWSAEKPLIPGYVHRGDVAISDGSLSVKETSISGKLTVDMSTIAVTSIGGGKDGAESVLEKHIQSDDFLSIAQFPNATLTIQSAQKAAVTDTYTVQATLEIKGVTKEVTFPAKLVGNEQGVHLTADFSIDRTRWDITYGSASFFENLAENAISDDVAIKLDLYAK